MTRSRCSIKIHALCKQAGLRGRLGSAVARISAGAVGVGRSGPSAPDRPLVGKDKAVQDRPEQAVEGFEIGRAGAVQVDQQRVAFAVRPDIDQVFADVLALTVADTAVDVRPAHGVGAPNPHSGFGASAETVQSMTEAGRPATVAGRGSPATRFGLVTIQLMKPAASNCCAGSALPSSPPGAMSIQNRTSRRRHTFGQSMTRLAISGGSLSGASDAPSAAALRQAS